MSLETRFHDSNSLAGPQYDFIAKPRNTVPGSNPTFASVPISAQRAPLAPGFVPEKPPGLSAWQKGGAAIALVLVIGVIASLVASFVLPMYDKYRREGQIKGTSIAFPKKLAGFTKQGGGATNPRVVDITSRFATPTPPQGASYVAGKRGVAVAAGAFAMSDQDQEDFLTAAGETARSRGVTLSDVDAGARGGRMQCGSTKTQTTCAFTDVAAYGVIVVSGKGTAGQSLALTVREATEVRR